jgi:hypothetical protein
LHHFARPSVIPVEINLVNPGFFAQFLYITQNTQRPSSKEISLKFPFLLDTGSQKSYQILFTQGACGADAVLQAFFELRFDRK